MMRGNSSWSMGHDNDGQRCWDRCHATSRTIALCQRCQMECPGAPPTDPLHIHHKDTYVTAHTPQRHVCTPPSQPITDPLHKHHKDTYVHHHHSQSQTHCTNTTKTRMYITITANHRPTAQTPQRHVHTSPSQPITDPLHIHHKDTYVHHHHSQSQTHCTNTTKTRMYLSLIHI